MSSQPQLGPWVRRFLLEHLVGERNLARNTQQSYRDTLRLLIPFAADRVGRNVDELEIEDLTAAVLQDFLNDLESTRGSTIATRNQRLAAIHSFAGFVAIRSPEHIEWCSTLRTIPFKKGQRSLVTYLEKDEIEAVLQAADCATDQGRRDHALLLFMYNTGTRANEVACLRIDDIEIGQGPVRDRSSVLIRGKGNKIRRCPLWRTTADEVAVLVGSREPHEHVFLNRLGNPITRYGVHAVVKRHVERATERAPSLGKKRVSPHTIRHTAAMSLLRAGVDINTIRAWLGHASLATTNVYAEADLEMKAKALEACKIDSDAVVPRWKNDKGLMDFLRTL